MPCGMKPLFADGAAPAASPSKDGIDGTPSKTARTPGGSTYRPSKINRSGDIAPETSRVFEYVSGKINAIEDEKEQQREVMTVGGVGHLDSQDHEDELESFCHAAPG